MPDTDLLRKETALDCATYEEGTNMATERRSKSGEGTVVGRWMINTFVDKLSLI